MVPMIGKLIISIEIECKEIKANICITLEDGKLTEDNFKINLTALRTLPPRK